MSDPTPPPPVADESPTATTPPHTSPADTPLTAPPANGGSGLAVSQEDRTMGMACHLSAFAGLLIPFGNIIGPLIVWQVKKKDSAFVDDQGKEALNFQITVTIAAVAATIVGLLLMFVLIGIVVLPLLVLAVLAYTVIFTIIAGIKANGGERYRYPINIRML